MRKYTQIPLILLARAISLWLKGYVHVPKDQNGSIIKGKEDFKIFRKVELHIKNKQQTNPGIILKIFFRFNRFSLRVNRILSLIPIPFIIAQPGFRSKTWMSGRDTGTFHGLYEWDTIEDAKQYLESLPLSLMKKRAIPETLIFEIVDNEKKNNQ